MTILGLSCSPNGPASAAHKLMLRALEGSCCHRKSIAISIDMSAKQIQEKIIEADGLIIATPVHWFNVSIIAKWLIDEVFWDFSGEPYTLEDMPVGIIATCNEDGANQAIANIAMPLNHCGLFVPPFGTLIHNLSMPGHGENGWQDDAESIGLQVAKFA